MSSFEPNSPQTRGRSPRDPGGQVPFVVIPDTPSVMVTVMDQAFREVTHAMGTVETTVAPGIYQIEQRFGGAVERHHVEVGTEAFVERLPLPRIPAPAPVEGTATARDDHREAAQRWSLWPTLGHGVPTLMVMVRSLRRGWPLDPYALEVAAADGSPVDGGEAGWRSSGGQEWTAWSGELPPGGYRLRMRGPTGDGLPLAQSLWLSEDWTTLVFVSNGPSGPQPQHATVQMVRRGEGWSARDTSVSLARETALSGLRQGRDLVSAEQLSLMLHSKRADPFLGVIGAHALLLHRTPDMGRFSRIMDNLVAHAPGHPDVAALCTLCERTVSVEAAPMLAASCRLLVQADAVDPGVIVDGSPAETVAEHLVGRGVWTTWLEQEPFRGGPAARGDSSALARTPPASDPVHRVQEYVQEIAAVEGKGVAEVLRSVPAPELCRRTGLPHRAVDRAIEGLRSQDEGFTGPDEGFRSSPPR